MAWMFRAHSTIQLDISLRISKGMPADNASFARSVALYERLQPGLADNLSGALRGKRLV